MSQFHPLLKIHVRLGMRAQGKGFWEIQDAMSGWTDDLPGLAAKIAGVTIPDELTADGPVGGALGDLFQKFLEFLSSPAGQALIAMLIKLLLGGI